ATEFTFRVHPVSTVTTFAVNWHWSDARVAFDAWQRWAPHAPDGYFSACVLGAGAGGTPSVAVSGQLIGRNPDLSALANAGSPTRVLTHERPWLDAALMWAGCGKGYADCHLDPLGSLERATFAGKSDYFSKPLPSSGLDTLVHALESRAAGSAE